MDSLDFLARRQLMAGFKHKGQWERNGQPVEKYVDTLYNELARLSSLLLPSGIPMNYFMFLTLGWS
jgi:hypothetical protein